MRIRLLAVAAAALAMLVSVARAQAAQGDTKQFYVGIGFAYGIYNLSGGSVSLPSEYKDGLAYYGELGIRLKGKYGLGIEADYYARSGAIGSIDVWYYNAAARFYPSASSNFWFKGLIGYATTSGSYFGGGGYGGSASSDGFALGAGLGYDLHLGPTFTLVPFVQYLAQLSGSSGGYKSDLFMAGGQIAISP